MRILFDFNGCSLKIARGTERSVIAGPSRYLKNYGGRGFYLLAGVNKLANYSNPGVTHFFSVKGGGLGGRSPPSLTGRVWGGGSPPQLNRGGSGRAEPPQLTHQSRD